MSNFKNFLSNPYIFFWKLNQYHFFDHLSDEAYLKLKYHAAMGKKLNLTNPATYNEKLQWIKLYDHNPLYTTLVDKYEVKSYVSHLIGSKYIIPTLAVWNSFDDINFDILPNQFVLKCTHDSGGLVIVYDKNRFNLNSSREKLNASLNRNYYLIGREWPYKNVKPRIIAEKYMRDEETDELRDYKFFCFDGKVEYLFIASDRNKPGEEVKFDFFDRNFRKLPMRQAVHPNSNYHIQKPKTFEQMIEIAEKLSQNIPAVRIDLYEVNGQVYFGEYTFFHHGGMVPFIPEEYDVIWGEKIKLPNK